MDLIKARVSQTLIFWLVLFKLIITASFSENLYWQEQNRDLHETFHDQLDKAEDGFSLIADYFGRGVFNKLTVVTDAPIHMPTSMCPVYFPTQSTILLSQF